MTIYTVIIEGNIASGKTTMVSKLRQNIPDFSVFAEPVEKWQKVVQDGQEVNLLQQFYEEPRKYAVPFQLEVARTFAEIHKLDVPTPFKVMERSIHSSEIFQQVLLEEGVLSSAEHEILQQAKASICQADSFAPDLIIYLRTEPGLCFQRAMARQRSEETSLSLDYLKRLHVAHDLYCARATAPVVKISGDQTPSEIYRAAVTSIFTAFCTDRLAKYLHAN